MNDVIIILSSSFIKLTLIVTFSFLFASFILFLIFISSPLFLLIIIGALSSLILDSERIFKTSSPKSIFLSFPFCLFSFSKFNLLSSFFSFFFFFFFLFFLFPFSFSSPKIKSFKFWFKNVSYIFSKIPLK